jgi:hypothetical protein
MLGNRIHASPAAYDIDLDGRLELMIGCKDFKFYVFDLNSQFADWPRFHYDPYNSGCYKSGYYTGSEIVDKKQLVRFDLRVYPTPFRQAANIKFQVPNVRNQISIKIYNIIGQQIKSISLPASDLSLPISVVWHGDDDLGRSVSSGVYFIRIESGDKQLTEKVVKIR